jgi:hypothetical protein
MRAADMIMGQMAERRAHQRRKTVLPVKVSVRGATHLAYTVDLARAGARLGGLRTELQVGETVILQRGSHKAKFRIVWVQQLNPNEMQAGVESLEPQDSFLGIDLSEQEGEGRKTVDMLMTLLTGDAKSDHPVVK